MHNPHEVVTGNPPPKRRWKISYRLAGEVRSIEAVARTAEAAENLILGFISDPPGEHEILSITDVTE